MKVAVISRVASPLHGVGGFERHVGALVRHLARAGLEVTVYTAPALENEGGLEGAHIEYVPYRIIPWPQRAGFVIVDRCTNYLVWSLRAGRGAIAGSPDIVQAEGVAGFGYALLKNEKSPPLVVHPVGMEEFKASGWKRTAYHPLRAGARFAARRAERILVPDRVMTQEVERYLSVDPSRMFLFPTPVDLEAVDHPVSPEARQAVLRRLGVDDQKTILLSVGRLESNKGFTVLAGSLARVRERLPEDWAWILVGRGPEATRIEEQIAELGLSDRARLAGQVSDEELSALYDRCDLFVHPTLYEGSSLVTLEAMAHAKPVVATRAGGIPDKVSEGETGFLVPPGDAEALGDAILRALALGERLPELGRKGRRRVESEFSWSSRIQSLVGLYRDLLQRPH